MTKQYTKNVEVYLDYATIPTLNYFYHFTENKDDIETIRLFGLGRFNISKSIIESYPEGIIRYCPIISEYQRAFQQLFIKLLTEDSFCQYRLNFHINLFHSWKMLIPLLHIIGQFKNKVLDIKLNFYDDGSEGLVMLSKIEQNYSTESLQKIIDIDSQSFYADKLSFLDADIARYLWNSLFESHYYLLNDFLLKNEKLSLLKNSVKYCHIMELERYLQFTQEEKDFFNELLGISIQSLKDKIKIFQQEKTFIFTGTTIFDLPKEEEEVLYHLHLNAILNYIHPNGKYFIGDGFTLIIKGHPHQKEMNLRLEKSFEKAVMLPDNIPFEILYLIGCKPDKIGGFVSTSYFSCDKKNIADLLFISAKQEEVRKNDYLFNIQYQLRDVMIKTGFIQEEKTHFYSDIPIFIS